MSALRSMLSLLAVIAAGTVVVLMASAGRDEAARIDELPPGGPGPLDGLVFVGMVGPEGKPKDVADTFVFDNGTFVSRECEVRCTYPARPYRATETGAGTVFTSLTRCPYKDATILWRGRVEGDRITGTARWTLRRWYWTVTRDFTFEGTLQAPQAEISGAD